MFGSTLLTWSVIYNVCHEQTISNTPYIHTQQIHIQTHRHIKATNPSKQSSRGGGGVLLLLLLWCCPCGCRVSQVSVCLSMLPYTMFHVYSSPTTLIPTNGRSSEAAAVAAASMLFALRLACTFSHGSPTNKATTMTKAFAVSCKYCHSLVMIV